MSYDLLSISAITIIVVFILVVIMINRNEASNEIKMRILARTLAMMQTNKEAMELCRKIHEKYPELCAGIDFTVKDNGDKVEIDQWNTDKPKPDK